MPSIHSPLDFGKANAVQQDPNSQSPSIDLNPLLTAINYTAEATLDFQRNSLATLPRHNIYALPGGEQEEFEYPGYFPRSVGEFIFLSSSETRTLLEFYDLQVLKVVRSDKPEWGWLAPVKMTDTDVEENKYICLEAIANHVGLRLEGIQHYLLDELRNRVSGDGMERGLWVKKEGDDDSNDDDEGDDEEGEGGKDENENEDHDSDSDGVKEEPRSE
ncbi:hypothetical protein TWF281_003655 [Arthrobotrys megalospora]